MIDREVASMAYPGAKFLDSLHHTFLSAASKGANHFYDEHPSQAGARQGQLCPCSSGVRAVVPLSSDLVSRGGSRS